MCADAVQIDNHCCEFWKAGAIEIDFECLRNSLAAEIIFSITSIND